MDTHRTIKVQSLSTEGIDGNKLKAVIRNNWFWLALIFMFINTAALLLIRYTKNIYQADSELKLDIKDEASDFGIKGVIEDQNLNQLAGELEIIQSKLFLNRVLDSSSIGISYYSIGRVLNEELYISQPFYVTPISSPKAIYDRPIYFDEKDAYRFTLKIDKEGKEISGQYDKPITLNGVTLLISKNPLFDSGDEIGYFFTLNSREALLHYLSQNLVVEVLNFNANTIRVSFKDHSPEKATAILQKIDTLYLQYSNEQKNLATKQKIDWLTNELKQIEDKMEEYENYFENFTIQNRSNNLEEDLKFTVDAINQLDSQRYDLTVKVNALNSLYDGIQTKNLANVLAYRSLLPPNIIKNLDALELLYLEQEKLKLSYNETTFAYRQKDKEIEILQNSLSDQLANIKKEWIQKLELINARKRTLERQFANLPDKNTQHLKNQRFYRLYEQLYLSLVQSKSQFEIAQAGSIPDYKILSPATKPSVPISPKRFIIAGIGFVGSIVAILFCIGLLYLLNNKITSVTDLESISEVPILGIVPASRYYLHGVGLHIREHPKSMVSESLRTIRTNLDFFNINERKKVIAISSTVSGEGKSFIALNLGGILASSKKKVILVDLDMRKPKIGLPVNVEDKTKGVSTILIKKNTWEECVIATEIDGFDYIPSGPHPPNPSELLLNGEFEGLIVDLKSKYDYIVLDTPPVGLVTDGIMAMKHADISIYIFRANYSRKNFLFNLQRIVNINKFTNITTLLNALPASGEQSYGYGYYEDPRKVDFIKKIFSR